ncbi:transglutaminase family protein [Haloplanus natans]|uniref:transglutaminase family protein n=1 Tax=Haloplanus natans TaxID=376171 RepID=UPI00067788D3|nr:transglutaminase domain-containing protein [Haloplanus natans]
MSGEGSDGPDETGVEYGEAALALAAVAALVVAAALLPAAGLGGGASEPSDRGTPAATATAEAGGERPASTAPMEALRGGSPSGVPLSQPPDRTRIGSTRGFEGELPQTPQFVVEGGENTYWRQTAYATYTGSAWSSSPQWRSIADGVPNDARTVDGRAMDYEVTLLVPSSSLPTAWQPSAVSVPNGSASVEASSVGGVRATRRLPAETTYLARSAAPPADPSTLRAAGTDYPQGIEERYTQLPESTPDRVGAFTDELTAGDETAYDRAVTIRDWLKGKPYSLNASHEPGEPVADQFIFEMESGYCQYYATSMVVMLRTQGIPARYVVGYAPGERVGEKQYLVTADRGHAWVEAFFPGTGWVRFDPTASGRLPVQNPQPPYDISLNRSAVAGAPVTVSVAKNGSPVVGAPVEINGERVGWTGANGTVRTRLPYAAELTVTARPPDGASKYEGARSSGNRTGADGGTAADLWAGGAALPAGGGAVTDGLPIATQRAAPAPNGSSRTYRSDTNVTITVEGTPVSGGGMTVWAVIRDVPVRGATVTLDGERGDDDGSGVRRRRGATSRAAAAESLGVGAASRVPGRFGDGDDDAERDAGRRRRGDRRRTRGGHDDRKRHARRLAPGRRRRQRRRPRPGRWGSAGVPSARPQRRRRRRRRTGRPRTRRPGAPAAKRHRAARGPGGGGATASDRRVGGERLRPGRRPSRRRGEDAPSRAGASRSVPGTTRDAGAGRTRGARSASIRPAAPPVAGGGAVAERVGRIEVERWGRSRDDGLGARRRGRRRRDGDAP